MPIHYTTDPMQYDLVEKDTYICCYPSISLKQEHMEEVIPREIYKLYPYASYYNVYAANDAKRAKTGECQVFPPTDVAPGIINLYIHIYPIFRTYPQDNHVLRIKWYTAALEKLSQTHGIKALHLTLPTGTGHEKRDYIHTLDDFSNSYKLTNKVSIDIFIHGEEPPEKQEIKVKQKIEHKAKQASGTSTDSIQEAPTTASTSAAVPKKQKTEYKLEFTTDQLCETVLYEIDFAKYKIDTEEAPSDEAASGIMKYFPDGWEQIKNDAILLEKAEEVDTALGALIGTEEIYPPAEDLFAAFKYCTTPKVIILGQDPYHGSGQAHGLSFSVQKGVAVPPSLKNIYKALENDTEVSPPFKAPKHGCLIEWAKQGVIMLNSGLTVPRGKPAEHLTQWEPFTDRLIKLLAQNYKNLIFVMWGTKAQKKKSLLGSSHVVLEYNHPSPQVNGNKFATECKHFSQINTFLQKYGKTPINWQLT